MRPTTTNDSGAFFTRPPSRFERISQKPFTTGDTKDTKEVLRFCDVKNHLLPPTFLGVPRVLCGEKLLIYRRQSNRTGNRLLGFVGGEWYGRRLQLFREPRLVPGLQDARAT